MKLKNPINFFYYLFSEGSSKILSYLSVLIVAKFFDIKTFGELTMYFVVNEFLIIIITNGISATTRIDFFHLTKSDYRIRKNRHLIVSLFLSIIIIVLAFFINSLNFKFILILSISAFFRTISLFVLADLQCNEKSKNYFWLNLSYILTFNLCYISLIFWGLKIESWIYSILIASFLQLIISLKYLQKTGFFNEFNLVSFSLNKLYNEYRSGVIFLPQAFGFWIRIGSERIILDFVTNLTVVGVYMFNFQLTWPIVILANVINLYLTPKINFMIKEKNWLKLKKTLNRSFLALISFAIFIIIIARMISRLFFYHKYFGSAHLIPLIAISSLFYALMLIFLNVFYYIGEKRFVSFFIFITSIIYVVICYLSTSMFGVIGLVVCNIIFNFTLFSFVITRLRKIISENNYLTTNKNL